MGPRHDERAGRPAAQPTDPAPAGVRIVRFGDAALLVELGDLAAVRRVDDALRAARAAADDDGALWAAVEDQVPAAETVLLRVRLGTDLRALARLVREVAQRAVAAADEPGADRPLVVLPVTYDGPDLHDVAALTGLGVDEVVARHSTATYTVAFGGFMPGFAYLVGLDPTLVVPRLATPRPRVPAGAVAVADRFSAVYPAATPGGWRLLGTCPTRLFDVTRDEPALLTPGMRVRFEVAR